MNAVRPIEFSRQKRSFDGSVIAAEVAQRFPYLLADVVLRWRLLLLCLFGELADNASEQTTNLGQNFTLLCKV